MCYMENIGHNEMLHLSLQPFQTADSDSNKSMRSNGGESSGIVDDDGQCAWEEDGESSSSGACSSSESSGEIWQDEDMHEFENDGNGQSVQSVLVTSYEEGELDGFQ